MAPVTITNIQSINAFPNDGGFNNTVEDGNPPP
jgi:hypothetical protein